MKKNLLRQLKDIQYQAEKLENSKPTLTDVENFKNYSSELKAYLVENVDLEEMNYLIEEIPEINLDKKTSDFVLFLFAPAFLKAYFRDKKKIEQALETIVR